jgi:hypothetical protein
MWELYTAVISTTAGLVVNGSFDEPGQSSPSGAQCNAIDPEFSYQHRPNLPCLRSSYSAAALCVTAHSCASLSKHAIHCGVSHHYPRRIKPSDKPDPDSHPGEPHLASNYWLANVMLNGAVADGTTLIQSMARIW